MTQAAQQSRAAVGKRRRRIKIVIAHPFCNGCNGFAIFLGIQ